MPHVDLARRQSALGVALAVVLELGAEGHVPPILRGVPVGRFASANPGHVHRHACQQLRRRRQHLGEVRRLQRDPLQRGALHAALVVVAQAIVDGLGEEPDVLTRARPASPAAPLLHGGAGAPLHGQSRHARVVVVHADAVATEIDNGADVRDREGRLGYVGCQHDAPLAWLDWIQRPLVDFRVERGVHGEDAGGILGPAAVIDLLLHLELHVPDLLEPGQKHQGDGGPAHPQLAEQPGGHARELLAQVAQLGRALPGGELLVLVREAAEADALEVDIGPLPRDVVPEIFTHLERAAAG
mmetsp:Transcript_49258/g.130826  ORF Transcript_49258/g.130826 Transcript_49258/m.130826 type:complete len:299 (-) Transcript_49258:574-1470(-)